MPPGAIPSVVGPFNVFDARVFVSQALIDLRAMNDLRAERHHVAAAQLTVKSARDLVVLVAVSLYLQANAAAARAVSAHAQLKTAETISIQTNDMKTNGLVAGIDVLRADV